MPISNNSNIDIARDIPDYGDENISRRDAPLQRRIISKRKRYLKEEDIPNELRDLFANVKL